VDTFLGRALTDVTTGLPNIPYFRIIQNWEERRARRRKTQVRVVRVAVTGGADASHRALIWRLYRDLKAYRRNPAKARKAALRARFDRIFTRKTGFVTLDRLLARLHANKSELLKVLDRPEIPLHTNGSENDIRCQVTKRKISGGTRSDAGRDCRDAFLGLNKTCAKLGIAFWDYLGARLVPGSIAIPSLAELVSARASQPP